VSHRELRIPGIEPLNGAGVYYGAAVTEARYYRDQQVFVVGGANSAGQGAMFLSRYARQVTLVARSSSLQKGMSQYLVDQIAETDNIEVLLRTQVIEVKGEEKLEAIIVKHIGTDEIETVPATAMFIFIGAIPRSDFVAGVVERNRAGFILTGQDLIRNNRRPEKWRLRRDPFLLESSVPGIFAAGDVRQGSPFRVASAVGQGGMSISLVHQYLKTV
jgi:thioredoxin reductase (NADPH)